MKSSSRIIAVITSIFMAFTMLAMPVKAETDNVYENESLIIVNPAFESMVTEADVEYFEENLSIQSNSNSSNGYVSSIEEAGLVLREKMLQRESEVEITLRTTSSYDSWDIYDQVYKIAVAHTGVPNEGDYLGFSWWMRGGSCDETSYGDYREIELTYSFDFNSTKAHEDEVTQAVNELKKDLLLEGKSDYEKIVEIYRYICTNITYDYENMEDYSYHLKHSAYGALIDKTAVCQGYALLFYRLLLEYNIDTRIISGIANGGDHAWNIVKLGDLYYNADSTWDAHLNHRYGCFLKGMSDFDSHISDEDFVSNEFMMKHPISEESYPVKEEDNYACNHSLVTKIAPEPTCLEEGLKVIWCNKCGYEKESVILEKTPHEWITNEGIKATCVSTGLIEGKFCMNCDTEIPQEVIPKTAHNPVVKEHVKATFDRYGYIITACDYCWKVFSDVDIAPIDNVKLSTTAYTYDGKIKKPTVTVKDINGNKLINGTDYTVKYANGRKNVGKYTVNITFKGNYKGSTKLTFKINPKGTNITKLSKNGKKQFTVKWAKRTTQVTGYEIRYSTKSNMSNAKKLIVKSNKTTSKTVKKLKSKKKYWVQVRTYKIFNGTKYYSKWSDKKTIITK